MLRSIFIAIWPFTTGYDKMYLRQSDALVEAFQDNRFNEIIRSQYLMHKP